MKHLPLNNAEYEKLYRDFYQFIKVKHYSRGKDTMYPSCAREFLFFVESRGIDNISDVKALDVIAYHEYLKERPNQRRDGGLSDSMIRHHVFSLRLFFDFLIDSGIRDSSPIYLPKFSMGKHKEREILTEEEVQQVIKACKDRREKALLAIAYGCGLRRTEIAKLNIKDIQFGKGSLTVRDGKFGKSRSVPLSNNVIRDLQDYVVNQRPDFITAKTSYEPDAFFLNNTGTRTSGIFLLNTLKQILARTQNPDILKKEITLHNLRHSIATHLLDHGATMEFVRDFLGHVEMDTSQLYAKRRKQRMKIQQQIR